MEPGGSQVPADYVVQFGRVASSSLSSEADTGDTRAVLYSVEGIGSPDNDGEVDPAAEVFGALGVVGRPLEPEVARGRSAHAEVLCVRTADGLVPIAARDLRLRMQGDGPTPGTIALLGYGGGFHSLSPVDGDPSKGTIHVVYCPYDFDADGAAQKAHAIVLDPSSGNESLSLVHADGQAILLTNDGGVRLQSPNGQTYVQVKNDAVEISAKKLMLNGACFIGDAATAVPLLGGAASQPSARLFLSTP